MLTPIITTSSGAKKSEFYRHMRLPTQPEWPQTTNSKTKPTHKQKNKKHIPLICLNKRGYFKRVGIITLAGEMERKQQRFLNTSSHFSVKAL